MFINSLATSLAFVSSVSRDGIVQNPPFYSCLRRIHTGNRISHIGISFMSASEISSTSQGSEQITSQDDASAFESLFQGISASPDGLLDLRSSKGERGIFLNRDVGTDDAILRIPISSCVRDDMPPDWYDQAQSDDDENPHPYNPSKWAIRLAASLIDLDLCSNEGADDEDILRAKKQWLAMMPDPQYLRACLPLHWQEEILSNSKCTALEIANDSTYFARADAVSELQAALQSSEAQNELCAERKLDVISLCNNAFDLVQTRCCRVERIDGVQLCPPLRVVAPIFDFINHGSSQYVGEGSSNAYFGLEGEGEDRALVVRTRRGIPADNQILIDYGDSARPSWRCLASYGFVPDYRVLGPDDEPFDGADECVAEVFYNGGRYEVSSHTIPTELVEAAYASYLEEEEGARAFTMVDSTDESENIFPPAVALRLAKRISDAAFDIVIDRPETNERKMRSKDEFDPDLLANDLAKSLRWSQNKVLLACAVGLRDYAAREDTSN
mmetsp:Transcript_8875/g.13427  ORF Transcript_8875/g.13427 Transcript_8875/m.13427 type:complete len:500 (-) Transcript_8875:164-1663(-)